MAKVDFIAGNGVIVTVRQNDPDEMWEFLLPMINVARHRITFTEYLEWGNEVKKITTGLVLLPFENASWCDSDGVLFKDGMVPVRVTCNKEHVQDIIELTLTYYQQPAIMAYKISDTCVVRNSGNRQ